MTTKEKIDIAADNYYRGFVNLMEELKDSAGIPDAIEDPDGEFMNANWKVIQDKAFSDLKKDGWI